MTNELQIFNYAEQHQIRTTLIDGEAWFVAKDIAEALGYKDTDQAIRYHVDDRDKLTRKFNGSGQNRDMTIINESGMYSLVLSSKLPSAKEFKHWVTSKVLPSIHKTGMYVTNKVIARLEQEVRELRAKVEEMYPINVLGNTVLAQKGAISFKDGATFLSQHGVEIGQNRLFKYCRDKKLLCSRKGRQWNRPTQAAVDKGLFNIEINGGFNTITLITPKGLQYLTDEFMKDKYPLLVLMASKYEVETRD